jgi:hypothetical protein
MEMVLETLVISPFNHLTRLVAREDFIKHSRRESSRSYVLVLCPDSLSHLLCLYTLDLNPRVKIPDWLSVSDRIGTLHCLLWATFFKSGYNNRFVYVSTLFLSTESMEKVT